MRAFANNCFILLLWVTTGINSANADTLPLPDLVVFPANIPLSTPKTITVTLKITDPTYISGSAILNLLSVDNKVVKKLATFADGGLNGDLVAGDKTYTAQFTLTASTPQQYRIAGSVAYKGLILRVKTSVSTITAIATEVPPIVSGITIGKNTIQFIDAQGNPTTPLPIKRFESTSVVTNSGTNAITINDTPVESELHQTVGVFSHKVTSDINADEGINLPTDFSYYGVDGTLLFKRTSAAGRQYYIDPNKKLISADGSRVLLIEVSDEKTNPSIELMSQAGDVFASYPAPLEYSYISEAYLTSNGRYIGLIGKGVTEEDFSDLVTVIDANTGARVTRSYPPDALPILAENNIGSFTIITSGNVQEQLP